jgi:protoporphyrinogen oxidase
MERVIVLGGGLAGLVCAKTLATAGVDVEVWEAADRFGGKAGSTIVNGRWVDHGYHIFPAWYRNTRVLLDELGVKLCENRDFYEVQPRAYKPNPRGVKIRSRIFSRTLVVSLDLISRPEWYLDDLSVDGFLRSRLYAGRSAGDRLREISRKALGSPAYLTSSLSMRQNLRWWLRAGGKPNWNALPGPMQTTFVEPLVEATRAAGADLCLNTTVERIELRGRRLVATASGPKGSVTTPDDALVVSALPVEVLQKLASVQPRVAASLLAQASPLVDIQNLETTPLAALDLHLTRRVTDLPPAHFILRESEYELTGLDITPRWKDYAGHDHPTVLQLIAGETSRIRPVSDRQFAEALIEDAARFFPFDVEDVDWEHTTVMKHVHEPLFANNVGSNSRRISPLAKDVPNLRVIGDHAKTEVDLACMEGAIYSGLLAADAILGIEPGRGAARPLRGFPRWVIGVLKVVRYPLGWLSLPVRLVRDPWIWRGNRRRDEATGKKKPEYYPKYT